MHLPPGTHRVLPAAAAVFLLTSPALAGDNAKPKVEDIYQQNCAACHGANFEGGVGTSLIKGYWKHGDTDADLTRDIEKGFPDLGMPPWDDTLSSTQIRSLVVFLRERNQQEERKKISLPHPDRDAPVSTRHEKYQLEILTRDLRTPWGLDFLPDGRMIVTERKGPVRVVSADGRQVGPPVRNAPFTIENGQGGMMAVGIHPDYEHNGWIYLAFADGWRDDRNNPKVLTAVARGRIKDNTWTDQEWIYRADRKFYTGAGVHFGTRFVFDKGYVYFVVGERGGKMEAQDIHRPNGKVFRLFDDGRVPPDNPFVNEPGSEPGIWSYGHRNPQGLAMDPRDGSLYDTEHGPRGGDEFNLILKGHNYGWPVITLGMDYDGRPIPESVGTAKEGMDQPVTFWVPSIAACGLAAYTGDKFPKWKGDFFAGSLKAQELHRLHVVDKKVTEEEIVLKDVGQVRDVVNGPDGNIYLLLNGQDALARLVPVP